MTTTLPPPHLSQDELVASALGAAPASVQEHLAVCDACRAEMETYRSITHGLRNVFCTPTPQVHVFRCQRGLAPENHTCIVEHPVTGHRLTISCRDGWLNGHLTMPPSESPENLECAVRLFSQQGLVGNVPVAEDGSFLTRCLNSGQRHSLTVVLQGDGAALQVLTDPDQDKSPPD